MAEGLARLRGTRNVYLRHMKNVEKKLSEILNGIDLGDEDSVSRLESMRDGYKEKLEQVKKLDSRIIEVLADEEGEEELGETLTRNDECRTHLFRAEQVLKRAAKNDENPSETRSSKKDVDQTGINIKLPDLEIKLFDGDILNWQSFWDQFDSTINSKKSISDIDKFSYLKTLICESANETISGLALTSSNYHEALELLKSRYGNTQLLINTYMKRFVSLPQIQNVNDVDGLRALYNQVEASVRNLKSLNVNTDSYGCLLVPLLNEKIPNEIRMMLARRFKEDNWSLLEMLDVIKQEVQAKERSSVSSSIKNTPVERKSMFSTQSLHVDTERDNHCAYCSQNHSSSKCLKITDPIARKELLRQNRMCFICLKQGHTANRCLKKYNCFKCSGKHHISICYKGRNTSSVQNSKEEEIKEKGRNSFVTQTSSNNNKILLQTAQARVSSLNNEQKKNIKLLFDSGSQRTYVTEKLRNDLQLKKLRTEPIIIKTFGMENSCVKNIDVVSLNVNCPNRDVVVEALVVPLICSDLIYQNVVPISKSYSHLCNLKLADNLYSENASVDLLIGLDHYYSFFTGAIRKGDVDEPVALESYLGWVVCGKFSDHLTSTHSVTCLRINTEHGELRDSHEDDSLREAVSKFWEVDSLGISTSESNVYSNFENDLKFNGQRYVTKLPFKPYKETLPDNFDISKKRLVSLKRKLDRDVKLREDYAKIIDDYEKEGIIEAVQDDNLYNNSSVHYLPHRGVLRTEKETSKLRIVYDASAKHDQQPSLNDILYSGPCLLPLLFEILLRFRIGTIGVVADIKQAFLQIEIAEEHRDFLRFLWYEDVSMTNPKLVIKRFTRVIFGITSGPFLLGGTIEVHLNKFIQNGIDVELIKKLLQDLYVDDSTNSFNEENEAYYFYQKAKQYLAEGGFDLRKWATNDSSLRRRIKESENKETPHVQESNNETKEQLRKVLGVNWDIESDDFVYDFSEIIETARTLDITKRNILRIAAMFFDPIGLISPVVLQAKLLFKRLCFGKLGWDDKVPGDVECEWVEFLKNLESLRQVRISRCIFAEGKGVVKGIELHGFCDSSALAYGCAIYIRVITNNSIHVYLWTAKCRLAPMKLNNIPRLELLSCLLLTKLITSLQSAIKNIVSITKIVCWSDSQIALWWIKQTRKEWKIWVENRVTEIRKAIEPSNWRYVRSVDNPADIATRKRACQELFRSRLWVEGPVFLRRDEGSWEIVDVDLVEPVSSCLEERSYKGGKM